MAVLVRYLSFAIVGAAGCVLAIAGVGTAPVMLAGAGMALHVTADVLTLCRFQRTLRCRGGQQVRADWFRAM